MAPLSRSLSSDDRYQRRLRFDQAQPAQQDLICYCRFTSGYRNQLSAIFSADVKKEEKRKKKEREEKKKREEERERERKKKRKRKRKEKNI